MKASGHEFAVVEELQSYINEESNAVVAVPEEVAEEVANSQPVEPSGNAHEDNNQQ